MSRDLRFGTWVAVFFFALVFTGETFAGVTGGIRRGGHRRTVADHVVAFAALEALSEGTGWGRFVLRDDMLPSGEERSVDVSVFDLEPKAEYLVEADGIEVGVIVTDRKGDARLELKARNWRSGDIPTELPAANEVVRASVFGAWGGVVLEGFFTVVREHVTDPAVHREKICLEAEDGFEVKGMAAVCRKESGAQGFTTMASGLESGLSYSIVVDTIVVGIVTADEEGQAGLELHVPDDENPLPAELQPVDNIRDVQWFQGELLILTGVFTGESDTDDRCNEFEGSFAGLTDEGFILKKGEAEVEIIVTEGTEFGGFDDLSQLEEGDWLEVEACIDGERLFARSVELGERERECRYLRGRVIGRNDYGFALQRGDDRFEVVVNDETEFKGFDSLDDLDGGEVVSLEGCFDGDEFVAAWVMLIEDDDCVELRGIVVEATDRGFVLEVGDDVVEVVVTEKTLLRGFDSLDALDGGEVVALEGCFDGDVLTAVWICLLEDDDCVELRGIVAERTESGFVLQVGDDLVEVAVTEETVLKNFDSLDEIDGGEVVALEGCFDGDVLMAVWVCLLEEDDCVELRGIVAERTDRGFVLQVGDDLVEVAVTGETELKGFESLDELEVGDEVALEGCFDGEILVAVWVCLFENDECVELHGVVVERTEIGFVLQVGDEWIAVAVTVETELKGFENLDELGEGDEVGLEGCFDGDLLVAAWIRLYADEPELEWWVADGSVVDLLDYGFAFEADGEVVIVKITDETVLDGYESADQIAGGDVVLVEGWWDGEKVYAARVVRPE